MPAPDRGSAAPQSGAPSLPSCQSPSQFPFQFAELGHVGGIDRLAAIAIVLGVVGAAIVLDVADDVAAAAVDPLALLVDLIAQPFAFVEVVGHLSVLSSGSR